MGAFESGLALGAQTRARQQEFAQQNLVAARDARAKLYEEALNNPDINEAQRQNLLHGYTSLFAPHEAPSLIERLSGLIHGQAKQGAKSAAQTAEALQPAPAVPPAAATLPVSAAAPSAASGGGPGVAAPAPSTTPAGVSGISTPPPDSTIQATESNGTPSSSDLPPSAYALAQGTPGTGAPTPIDTAAASAPPTHPFQSGGNPMIHALSAGIADIGNHLKGAAQPVVPAPEQDQGQLLAQTMMSPEALKERQMRLQSEAALRLSNAQTEKLLAGIHLRSQIGTPQKAALNTWAQQNGAPDFDSLPFDLQQKGLLAVKMSNTTPHWGVVKIGGNAYAENSVSGERKFIGPDSQITAQNRVSFQPQADGSVREVHYTTYSKKGSNEPIVDDAGAPIETSMLAQPTPPATPVSSAAPAATPAQSAPLGPMEGVSHPPPANAPASKASLHALVTHTNAKRTSAATGKGPVGAAVGYRPTPYDRALTTQFGKADTNARDLEASLQSAQEAAKNPTPTSDQALIYAWVKSNVKGAGRMTQTEFTQAGKAGNLEQRAQMAYNRTLGNGKIPDDMRANFIADLARNATVARTEAEGIRADAGAGSGIPQSSAPTSTNAPKGSLADRLHAALAGKK